MAKEYLLAADKYVKSGQFEKAREQIARARAADPTNPYIPAFEERIKHFEIQTTKAPAVAPPPAPAVASAPVAPQIPIVPQTPVVPPTPAIVDVPTTPVPPRPPVMPQVPIAPPIPVPSAAATVVEKPIEAPPIPSAPKPSPVPTPVVQAVPSQPVAPAAPPMQPTPVVPPPAPAPPVAPPPAPKPAVPPKPPTPEPMIAVTLTEPQQPIQRTAAPAPPPLAPAANYHAYHRESDVVRRTQSITYVPPEAPSPPRQQSDPALDDQIAEMRRQLQELTSALQNERKAREEVQKQQIETSVRQFRSALEKAWQFGAPKAKDVEDLRRLATSLNLPPDVESSATREVKLSMYGRAVKEVIAKRKNLKSSSSTLEWLRKVYQISLNEYLEYESQFLTDLVSDQFRGTMLFVALDEKVRSEFVPRFKSSGFAVVLANSPESALEKVDKLSPNVIICDATFGEGSLSGIKFLHIIRSNPKYNFIPFLLLADTADNAQIPTTDLRPNEAVVSKPTDYDELNAAMNDKLNQMRHYISTL